MIKYLDDYVDELADEFPMIKKKSIAKMVALMARVITMFMMRGAREFKVSSRKPLVKIKRKQETFYITRIMGLRHRKSILSKIMKHRENGKEEN